MLRAASPLGDGSSDRSTSAFLSRSGPTTERGCAAVEAARAGEAGRGFAVVADEVRALAMRSAEAARSTAKMIKESVSNVEEGVALNAVVIGSFREITDKVNAVVDAMTAIAERSEKQRSGVEQITTAIEGMNRLTQRVDALPAWPVAVSRLLTLVNDEASTNEQIAEALRLDAGLTANVLRLANSPLFGLRRAIADVDHATSILGRRRLSELAIAGAFSKTIPPRLTGYGMDGSHF
jgi:hypothetical protein